MIEAIRAGLTVCCLYGVALSLLMLAAIGVVQLWRNHREQLRRMKPDQIVVAAVGFFLAFVSGATKTVPNAGADEAIALVGVAVEYDETIEVTAVEVSFVGNNVTTATPVSVRNAETEQWRELEKIGATVTTDLATNVLAFAVSGDVSTNRFWWVGTETPAVIIETTGITIEHFAASSSSVQIMWTCDDPNATEFVIQRRRKGAANWETVGATSSLAFIYVGFTVGETWEWRVTSTYTEVD